MAQTTTSLQLTTRNDDEPIPELLMRFQRGHGVIREYLLEVERQSSLGNLHTAMSWISLIGPRILKHFAKEEAKLFDIIAEEGEKSTRDRAIKIIAQHRKLANFLTMKLPYLTELSLGTAKEEFDRFVMELKTQMIEEEEVVFALTRTLGLERAKKNLQEESNPPNPRSRHKELRS